MRYQSVLAASAAFVASVSAHATFQELWINNVDAGTSCARLPTSNNPVTSVTGSSIACNVFTPSSGVCNVNAGDSLTVEMHQQPGDRSCANQAIGGAHYGPVTVYMAKVSDATSADASSAGWFKVSQMGLPSSNPDYWGSQVLNVYGFLNYYLTTWLTTRVNRTIADTTPSRYLQISLPETILSVLKLSVSDQ